jgi:hypothetical protein
MYGRYRLTRRRMLEQTGDVPNRRMTSSTSSVFRGRRDWLERVKDWDEFTHLILEDEFWSHNWQKIRVDDRLVLDSGVYFQGTDAEGFAYLTTPRAIS